MRPEPSPLRRAPPARAAWRAPGGASAVARPLSPSAQSPMRHPTSLIRRARAAGAALRALLGTLLLAAIAAPASAVAGPVLDRVRASGQVRVCVWPDYYGITYRHPRTGALNNLPELVVGRKVNMPGPVSCALWPG